MLYVIGRTLTILCLIAINVSVNILWFKISAILGIAVLLAVFFVVYKTAVLAIQEKKEQQDPSYEILNNLN
jgi:hypothetical protein